MFFKLLSRTLVRRDYSWLQHIQFMFAAGGGNEFIKCILFLIHIKREKENVAWLYRLD